MISKREIEQMQKEILYPTYFNKLYKVKIKDLIIYQKYNLILQVAIKTQNNPKKIKTLSTVIQTQKSLQKLLRHGFNATHINVDDIHLLRREAESLSVAKLKEYLSQNPSELDQFLRNRPELKQQGLTEKMLERWVQDVKLSLLSETDKLGAIDENVESANLHEATHKSKILLDDLNSPKEGTKNQKTSHSPETMKQRGPPRKLFKSAMLPHDQLGSMTGETKRMAFHEIIKQLKQMKQRKSQEDLDSFSHCSLISGEDKDERQIQDKQPLLSYFGMKDREKLVKSVSPANFLDREDKIKSENKQRGQSKPLKDKQQYRSIQDLHSQKFFQNRKPKVLSNLSIKQYALSQVKRKLCKTQQEFNRMQKYTDDLVKKEDKKYQNKLREEKIIDKYYQYVCDKIDFNKKFFAPILEEEDLGKLNDQIIHAKENIKVKGRHLARLDTMGRIGIVPNMDKETADHNAFKTQQQKYVQPRFPQVPKDSKEYLFHNVIEKSGIVQKTIFSQDGERNKDEDIKKESIRSQLQSFYKEDQCRNTVMGRPRQKHELESMTTHFKTDKTQSRFFKTSSSMIPKRRGPSSQTKLTLEQITAQKKDSLQNIIGHCSEFMNKNKDERKLLAAWKQYNKQEYQELEQNFNSIEQVNFFLNNA